MRGALLWSSLITVASCGMNDAAVTSADNKMSVSQDVTIPPSQQVTVAALSCSSQNGEYVVSEAVLDLSGFTVAFEFRNNERGTHTATATSTIDLGVARLSAPVRSGVLDESDAYVWVQLLDASGRPLSDEVFVGNCGAPQGAVQTTAAVAAQAVLVAESRNCGNDKRATLSVSAALKLDGMQVRFIFRDSGDANDAVIATVDATAALSLVNDGTQVVLPKQPGKRGVGGNPWIYAQFLGSDGRPLSDQVLLGRCKAE